MTVLTLESVSKHFGGVKALSDVSLSVRQGERRLFIGTNGAGKTTLFNLIAGDFAPTKGSITLFGRDVTKISVRKRVKMGIRRTYQTSALFDGLNVRQNFNLALLGEMSPLSHFHPFRSVVEDAATNERIAAAADQVCLGDKLDAAVSSLSHGERRQLELGMAIAGSPRLLMFDEPCSGLSADERHTMLQLIRSLPADVTLILIEHDMEMAFAVADYITVLYDGRILVEGKPNEIKANEQVRRIYLGGGLNAAANSAS